MEVPFTPEQEALLARMAAHAGVDMQHFVKDIALRAVEENSQFRAAVRGGIVCANRGDLTDDDEVRSWLEERERSEC